MNHTLFNNESCYLTMNHIIYLFNAINIQLYIVFDLGEFLCHVSLSF